VSHAERIARMFACVKFGMMNGGWQMANGRWQMRVRRGAGGRGRARGWADGECEFCRCKGAVECVLRNVAREVPARVGIADVLRGMR
jgi:hypothetical protein